MINMAKGLYFSKKVLAGFALASLSLLFIKCDSGYEQKNGIITFNGKEITDKKFVVLNAAFGKDDTTAWYKRYVIPEADVKTFVAVDDHYAKDKNAVYYCDEKREGQNYYLTKHSIIFTVKGAEAANFAVLSNGYAKDSKRAYQNGLAFKVEDVETLSLVEGDFLKDKFQVYFSRRSVKNAQPNSFRVLNGSYAKDTARVYIYSYQPNDKQSVQEIPCEASTFAILDYPYSKDAHSLFYYDQKIQSSDVASFAIVGNDYSKDKAHVYYKSKVLKSVDPQTFSLIVDEDNREEFTYTKDKNQVFWENKPLIGASLASFKILGLGYATDGKLVFYHANIVKNADAASFKREENRYEDNDASDKNSKYLAGVRL